MELPDGLTEEMVLSWGGDWYDYERSKCDG